MKKKINLAKQISQMKKQRDREVYQMYRGNRQLTQKQLAEQFRITQPRVSQIIKEKALEDPEMASYYKTFRKVKQD
jgi:predicted XRE-type DNA-binding protein